MIQRRLFAELEKVARRYRRVRLFGALAANWLLAAVVGLLLLWWSANAAWFSPWTAAWLAGAFVMVGVALAWLAWRSVRGPNWVAQRIEARHPALQSRLLTAVQQQPDAAGRFGYLQETVIREALEHNRRYGWDSAVSDGKITAAHSAHFLSLAAFTAVLLTMAAIAGSRDDRLATSATSDASLVNIGRYRVDVKPGDVEIERGTSLVVVARFQGELPPDATLLVETATGNTEQLPMSRSLDDPLYGGRVAAVTEDLTYRVAFDQEQTQPFRVTVFEYPALVQADARLKFPDYTSMQETLIEDTRRVSAVEGTRLTWSLRLNKPIANGRLESEAGETLPLAPTEDDTTYTAELTLNESQRYRLHLEDAQGRANKEPPELVVNVLPNRPPEIEVAWPSRDAQVSPLEEFDVEASAWDDFGLKRYGLAYTHAGGDMQEIVLGDGGGPKERREMAHQVRFEELEAEPDQLFSYYFFAEDIGPDGQVRRAESDMFFAEVRPFEQVFRQGEQPPGGQQQQQGGQNAQQAEQLAELQKQIIAGTWNVLRRERPDKITSQFEPDVRLLVDSQNTAREQVEQLAGRVQDPQSLAHIEEVKEHMLRAIQELMQANDERSPEPLRQALTAEQAAYQALLKLRAREHQVMRSSSGQQGGGGGGASAMQQQLDQLELKDDENRYETQRTAQSQQDQQQQEVRQALSRLRELARRQEDLNKQLQELQSALEQAQTEEEREEIRRRLKRLREEQQQILRDIDELRDRMDQPQNQREMAEAQQRLAETRENVRRASEALEQGMVSQALAQGTRAQREFEELRDEFRRRAAGQFDEAMRHMREEARQLEEQQRRLAEQMQQADSQARPRSLRDSSAKQEIAQGLEQQKEDLKELLHQMEEVVQQAEQPEPLLADQLYDTVRRLRQSPTENALETARQLAQAGLLDQAAPAEETARRGIETLRQGVERAAESVLGDETAALERAHETLGELSEQLQREAEAQGQESGVRGQESEHSRRLTASGGQQREARPEESGVSGQETDAPRDLSQRGVEQASYESSETQQESQSPQGSEPGQPNESGQQNRSEQQARSSQPGQSQQGAPGDGQESQGPRSLRGEGRNASEQSGGPRSGNPGSRSFDGLGGFERMFDHQGEPMGPITGEAFREWSDRMRDVEEMLDDPDLRAEAAGIRDRARGMRIEYKRHSQEPNWELVQLEVIQPLNDLRNRIAEELIRRQAQDTLTPIDRDPVPPQFADPVRRYYEELGRGE